MNARTNITVRVPNIQSKYKPFYVGYNNINAICSKINVCCLKIIKFIGQTNKSRKITVCLFCVVF